MPILSQSTFPRLWLLFQRYLGGTADKRQLILRHYAKQPNVLEIGCSMGNIAKSFLQYEGIRYTGVDIDPVAISYSRRAFRQYASFEFIRADLTRRGLDGRRFDFVLLASVCHHIPDDGCKRLVDGAARLLSPDGIMVVIDPVLPRPDDPWLVRHYYLIDQGGFIRDSAKFQELLTGRPGLRLSLTTQEFIGATPSGWLKIMRYATYVLRHAA